MTLEIYGEEIQCQECGSDNTVEQTRSHYLDTLGKTTYPVVVCRTCGWEKSL